MSLLTDFQIQNLLKNLTDWEYIDNSIQKTYVFTSYMDSIEFINRLAEKAEATNHHPDIIVGWRKVKLSFTSHDKGGVTSSCIEMAIQADLVL